MAKVGRAEQTLTDTSVRDTWEITPDLVTLDGPAWEATLGAVLEDVRDELGLPSTTTLRAELHAMLIYGKGQFFLPHQDSEKDDAMVGTLVVSLPSAHTGGELIVEHGGESVTYRTSKQDLSFVAFYADCRHEVKPVTSGYPGDADVQPARGRRGRYTRVWAGRRSGALPDRALRRARHATLRPHRPPIRRTGSSTCSITSTPSGA